MLDEGVCFECGAPAETLWGEVWVCDSCIVPMAEELTRLAEKHDE